MEASPIFFQSWNVTFYFQHMGVNAFKWSLCLLEDHTFHFKQLDTVLAKQLLRHSRLLLQYPGVFLHLHFSAPVFQD